MAANPPQRGN